MGCVLLLVFFIEKLQFDAFLQKEEATHPILEALKQVSIESMTPLDALLLLSQWKKEYDTNDA